MAGRVTAYGGSCACARANCSSVGDPFDPSTCAVVDPPVYPSGTCCYLPLCGRLRVIILCQRPCGPLPVSGAAGRGFNTILGCSVASAAAPALNGPPATTITAGVPFGLSLAGRPGAVPDVATPVPDAVTATFGRAAVRGATQLVFDFGSRGGLSGGTYKKAYGRVLALGAAGAAQAALMFKYRFCAPLQRCYRPSTKPAFVVKGCTGKGLIFTVLDATSFLSQDPCTESVVVLNVQQYCPAPADSTPATISPCCSAPLDPMDVGPMLACDTCPGGGAGSSQ
jgi:hypothetical protein